MSYISGSALRKIVGAAWLFGSAQAFTQAVSFATGLIVVRLLVPEQFALYVMANTMVGTLNVLADSGLSRSALAQGGKVWRDPKELGSIMVTSVTLRRKFATLTGVVLMPFLFFMLSKHGASIFETAFILLGVVVLFQTALTSAIYEVALQLHQQVAVIASIRTQAVMLRFFSVLGGCFLFPVAFVALVAGLPSQTWINFRLKKSSSAMVDWSQPESKGVQDETLKLVKRILPGSIYYCINGQIALFLISIFGTTADVAQVGALTRLTQIAILVSAVFNVVVVPRFSRIPDTRVRQAFGGSLLAVLGISGVLFCFVVAFSGQLLWLLGNAYSGLQFELSLAVGASCLALVSGAIYSLGASRGWVAPPWLGIGLTISVQILLAMGLDMGSTRGALLFSMLTYIAPILVNTSYILWRIR